MRLIDADALINEIKKETEKAIEQDDKVGSFWLGYIAGLVIKQPTIQSALDSETIIRTIETGITATNSNDAYSLGMRNGMRWCKSLIDGAEPKFEDDVMSVDDGKELPTIQPEKAQLSRQSTTSDLISRTETVERLRGVLDATVPITDYDEGYVDGVEFGISTVSTMPTIQPVATDTNVGDTISRQATIDALNEYFSRIGKLKRRGLTEAEKAISLDTVGAIKTLPSVQPEPKEGKWEQVSAQKYFTSASYFYRCSVCGENNPRNTKYCPNCGADMRGEKDG